MTFGNIQTTAVFQSLVCHGQEENNHFYIHSKNQTSSSDRHIFLLVVVLKKGLSLKEVIQSHVRETTQIVLYA